MGKCQSTKEEETEDESTAKARPGRKSFLLDYTFGGHFAVSIHYRVLHDLNAVYHDGQSVRKVLYSVMQTPEGINPRGRLSKRGIKMGRIREYNDGLRFNRYLNFDSVFNNALNVVHRHNTVSARTTRCDGACGPARDAQANRKQEQTKAYKNTFHT